MLIIICLQIVAETSKLALCQCFWSKRKNFKSKVGEVATYIAFSGILVLTSINFQYFILSVYVAKLLGNVINCYF